MLTRCSVVIDYAGHSVGIVNDYPDMYKTTQTLSENFEGFSQILKEQSGKKVTWVHLCIHPIALKI